jgi:hypothetical protein
MTYDDTTRSVKLYVDYAQVASAQTVFNIVYDTSNFYLGDMAGGRAFDGWMDEARLSDAVLTSDQFLRVVTIPEPASLGLLGLIGAAMCRRRG